MNFFAQLKSLISKFGLIIFLLSIAALIAIGAYWYLSRPKQDTTQNNPTPSATPSVTETTTPSVSVTISAVPTEATQAPKFIDFTGHLFKTFEEGGAPQDATYTLQSIPDAAIQEEKLGDNCKWSHVTDFNVTEGIAGSFILQFDQPCQGVSGTGTVNSGFADVRVFPKLADDGSDIHFVRIKRSASEYDYVQVLTKPGEKVAVGMPYTRAISLYPPYKTDAGGAVQTFATLTIKDTSNANQAIATGDKGMQTIMITEIQ